MAPLWQVDSYRAPVYCYQHETTVCVLNQSLRKYSTESEVPRGSRRSGVDSL